MPRVSRVAAVVHIQLEAGQANMAKAGQALGPYGVNLVEVVRTYNTATGHQRGQIIPAVITIYEDRSFSLVIKTPPTSALLRQAAGLTKGAARPGGAPAGTLNRGQLREVAKRKLPDLNTDDLDAAERTVAGTARSMGIVITD
jgi:large subunit ribosomal protein L11